MSGDNRVRFCCACRLNVYNLSGMTRRDATELVQLVEGRLCVRFFLRKDGTLLTSDCPVGMRWTRVAALVASFLIAATLPFWGTLIVINWQDLQAAIMARVRPTPPEPVRELLGVTIRIEHPPSGTFERPRIPRTGDVEADTPPSREPREAR